MKRTWTIFALLFAGSISFANLQASSTTSQTVIQSYQLQQLYLTEEEAQVLQEAAPKFSLTYSELVLLYESGDATIENLGNGTYKVRAFVNDGNTMEAIIDGSL